MLASWDIVSDFPFSFSSWHCDCVPAAAQEPKNPKQSSYGTFCTQSQGKRNFPTMELVDIYGKLFYSNSQNNMLHALQTSAISI